MLIKDEIMSKYSKCKRKEKVMGKGLLNLCGLSEASVRRCKSLWRNIFLRTRYYMGASRISFLRSGLDKVKEC